MSFVNDIGQRPKGKHSIEPIVRKDITVGGIIEDEIKLLRTIKKACRVLVPVLDMGISEIEESFTLEQIHEYLEIMLPEPEKSGKERIKDLYDTHQVPEKYRIDFGAIMPKQEEEDKETE